MTGKGKCNFPILLPNRENHNCFGCGPNNPHGLKMQFYGYADSVQSMLVIPSHLSGWENLTHGGVISTILDEIMSWSAIYLLGRIILTQSMNVEYLHPVYTGKTILAKGKLLERENERKAWMEGFLYEADTNTLCAVSKGRFALFTPEAARKLKIMNDEAIRDFIPVLEKRSALYGKTCKEENEPGS